jgi:hypothetical protein
MLSSSRGKTLLLVEDLISSVLEFSEGHACALLFSVHIVTSKDGDMEGQQHRCGRQCGVRCSKSKRYQICAAE